MAGNVKYYVLLLACVGTVLVQGVPDRQQRAVFDPLPQYNSDNDVVVYPDESGVSSSTSWPVQKQPPGSRPDQRPVSRICRPGQRPMTGRPCIERRKVSNRPPGIKTLPVRPNVINRPQGRPNRNTPPGKPNGSNRPPGTPNGNNRPSGRPNANIRPPVIYKIKPGLATGPQITTFTASSEGDSE